MKNNIVWGSRKLKKLACDVRYAEFCDILIY